MCAAVAAAVLMCQVFYLRVLPTLILFARRPPPAARQRIQATVPPKNYHPVALVAGGWVWLVGHTTRVSTSLAFMFNSCTNCRGNLTSSVLNAMRCFWFMDPVAATATLGQAGVAGGRGIKGVNAALAVNSNSEMKLLLIYEQVSHTRSRSKNSLDA